MTRLLNAGCEWGSPSGDGLTGSAPAVMTAGTGTKRSGTYAWELTGTSGDTLAIPFGTGTLGRTYRARVYFRFTGSIAAYTAGSIFGIREAIGSALVDARLNTNGTLELLRNASTVIGSPSAALSADTWYRIELAVNIGTGAVDTAALLLDGASVASGSSLSISDNVPTDVAIVANAPGASTTFWWDDLALNDDQGASQNSWPGAGSVVLLRPTADSQVGTWTGGVGGTTNLFAALDNLPPAGTATETDTTQIESADGSPDNATDEYRATMQTYTAAGIAAGDAVVIAQAHAWHGEDVATGAKTGRFWIASNPAETDPGTAIINPFGPTGGGALGTWPTDWRLTNGASVDASGVTLGTAPVVHLRKMDTGTRVASVCALGVYVEYVPASSTPKSGADAGAGADTSASPAAALAGTDAGAGSDTSAGIMLATTTDAGTGADGNAVVSVPVAATDAGAGADTSAGIALGVRTDAGVGADTKVTLDNLTGTSTDAGAGSDAGASITLGTTTDAGIGSDGNAAVSVPIAATDAGAGADTASIGVDQSEASTHSSRLGRARLGAFRLAQLSTTTSVPMDAGAGTDTATVAVVLAVRTDSGAGGDSAASISLGIVTDAGAGADTSVGVALATTADSGAGADTSLLAAATDTRTDAGVGGEVASVDQGATAKSGADAGTGTDTAAGLVAATDVRTDAGAGADTSAGVSLAITTDAGAGTDVSAGITLGTTTDAGVGADTALLAVVLGTTADAGAGADTSVGVALGTTTDSGAGGDTSALAAASAVRTDAGAGSDTSVGIALAATDAGTGSDSAASVVALAAATDSGVGGEYATLGTGEAKSASDTGVGSDVSVSLVLTVSDTGAGAESVSGRGIGASDGSATSAIISNAPILFDAETGDVFVSLGGVLIAKTT